MDKNRRKFLQGLYGVVGSTALGSMMPAQAVLKKSAEERMIRAIVGVEAEEYRKAEYIGYHVLSQPDNSPTSKALKSMWERVRTKTNGWLVMVLIPKSGELPGADTEAVLATAKGRYDAITIAGPALDTLMTTTIGLQALAFAYPNSELARKTLNTAIYADAMQTAAQEFNLHSLRGLLNAGMRQMTTIEGYPLKSIEQLKGLKLRVAPSELYKRQLEVLGIRTIATPISSVLNMLKKREVQGQENPVNYAISFDFYKECKYLNMTNHFWSGFNTMINLDTWKSWPGWVKEIVSDEYRNSIGKQWLSVEQSNSSSKALCLKYGMRLVNTNTMDAAKLLRDVQETIINDLDNSLQPIAKALIER